MTSTVAIAPFVSLHALQAFPPSLLNRDDSNAAKQIIFGDTPRVRVSSASSKRAIRTAMRTNRIAGGEYGLRTSHFPALTAAALVDKCGRPADVAAAKVGAVFRALNLKVTDKGDTAVMVFGREQLPQSMAAVVDAAWDQIGDDVPADVVTAARAALDPGAAIDIALFGRMLAEVPVGGRIDGAVGVAHSFSVDAAAIEPDFWTAVDDATPEGEPVSGNLGESMVSAPILYRCASLDRQQLRTNLAAAADEAERLAQAAERSFIEWFISAVPMAKQRSSVAGTLPSVVVATAGRQVLSGASAFAVPICGPDVVGGATTALLGTLGRYGAAIGQTQQAVLVLDPALDPVLSDVGALTTIAAFADAVARL